jgi:histidinol-phosphate aminotransferase
MTAPKLTPLITSLPATTPFVGPEVQERAVGHRFAARIGANENVFGPSPQAIKAMQDAASECWMYGDSSSHDLRTAIGAHHNIKIENIIVGAGIDGLLGSVVRLLVAQGDKVVTSKGAYPTFDYHVTGFGGELVKVPYLNDAEDPEALLAKAGKVGAKLLYFANPDNPMASYHNADVLGDMIRRVPDGCLLVLDEAYVEFAPKGTAVTIQVDNPNVIIMRTFSKAYAMAGARVGYAIGHRDLIAEFGKVRDHFGMSRISQAGALAALGDQNYLQQTIKKIASARNRISRIARKNGLDPLPSATNFVTIDCGQTGDFSRAIVAELAKLGIFIRMPFAAPQDRCIRVSAGTDHDLDLFEVALPKAIKTARKNIS